MPPVAILISMYWRRVASRRSNLLLLWWRVSYSIDRDTAVGADLREDFCGNKRKKGEGEVIIISSSRLLSVTGLFMQGKKTWTSAKNIFGLKRV